MTFRLPANGAEDGIMAAGLTALVTGFKAELNYNPTVTSGCGAEPRIGYLTIIAPGY